MRRYFRKRYAPDSFFTMCMLLFLQKLIADAANA
jgi:hypothetical protein